MATTKRIDKKKSILRCITALFLLVLLLLGSFVVYRVKITGNVPNSNKYTVYGVDVSRYQGDIEWDTLAEQDIAFAFLKATEGSSYVDSSFAINWVQSQESGIIVGAYHFFSFESAGETQAENYIATVGELFNNLPPVVDLEYYGEYVNNPLSREETREILDALLLTLEEYYGVKPILYTTTMCYYQYIFGGDYGDYPLWIRNTYYEPFENWTFWQYSDEGTLEGISGEVGYIDLNVYRSSWETFLSTFGLVEEVT